MFGSKPKGPTPEQRDLEAAQTERLKELRVDTAREQSRNFSEQNAVRRRLRGLTSLLSGGFKGFK
jgi:hypothetical protein